MKTCLLVAWLLTCVCVLGNENRIRLGMRSWAETNAADLSAVGGASPKPSETEIAAHAGVGRISVELKMSTPLATHATFDLGVGELLLSLRGPQRGEPVVLAALQFAGGAAGHLAPDSLYRFVLSADGISLLLNSVVGPALRPDTRMAEGGGLSSSGSISYPAGRFGWIDHSKPPGRKIGVVGNPPS